MSGHAGARRAVRGGHATRLVDDDEPGRHLRDDARAEALAALGSIAIELGAQLELLSLVLQLANDRLERLDDELRLPLRAIE